MQNNDVLFTSLAGAGLMAGAASDAVAGGTLPNLNREMYVSGLSDPLGFVQDPSNRRVQYVVEQGGRIRVVLDGRLQDTEFINLASRIRAGGEQGLLGLAFPADYGDKGLFYVNYTRAGDGATVIARYQRDPNNPLRGLFNSEDIILIVPQDISNHNGGNVAFGPNDGYLYIGMGDGGREYDRAQDPNQLLGKMLRLDVNGDDFPQDPNRDYRIPPDNPFVDNDPIDAREEIWAFGMRNPWRWSFDDPNLGGTGALVIADVGATAWEEVNYEPAGAGGRNYGWPRFEGLWIHQDRQLAYKPHTPPIHVYSHHEGRAIIGGFVYRGHEMGCAYQGRYFFADLSGRLWSLGLTIDENGEATVSDVVEHTGDTGGLPAATSFGVDADGELYGVSYSGVVYKYVSEQGSATLTGFKLDDGTLISGDLDDLNESDDSFLMIEARVTGADHQTHLINLQINADTDAQNVEWVDIVFESRITDVTSQVMLFLRNQNNGNLVQIDQFEVEFAESMHHSCRSNAAHFVAADGTMELLIRQVVLLPITLNGFHSLIDDVEIKAH